MKKIYLLLTLLLGVLLPPMAFAQDDPFDLRLKTISIGPAVGEFEPNTWYFLYQGRGGTQGAGDYEFMSIGDVPGSNGEAGGVLKDMGENQQIKKITYEDVSGGDILALEKAAYLLRFVPVPDEEDVYYLQFGTGRYMSADVLDGNGNSKFICLPSIYDAQPFMIYSIEDPSVGHFGVNVFDVETQAIKKPLDNNGTGYVINTWGNNGRLTEAVNNNVWSIHEVEWGTVEEFEAALNALITAYEQYASYAGGYFVAGSHPGQYDAVAIAAFEKAIDDAKIIDDGDPETLSVEQLYALRDAIVATYEAVIASKVSVAVPDGYYRIRGAMKYNGLVVIDQDEKGNDITEEQAVVDKYMYSAVDGEKIYGRWYTPADLSSDATVLWKVTNKDGYYDIVNEVTKARFMNVSTSANVEMSIESTNLMALDPVAYVEGDEETPGYSVLNIRVSTQAANDYFYLHQGGHAGGAGKEGYLVGWSTTVAPDNYGASEWIFDPISEEEVKAILDAFAPVMKYKEVLADAKKKLDITKGMKLITSAGQLSSPWTDPAEGALPNLIDGDVNSFWHSSWHDNPPHSVQGSHYLQVELPDGYYSEGTLLNFQFTRRAVQNDHITLWSVRGTNENLNTDLQDPLTDKEECEELLLQETPYTSNTETLTSDFFDPKGYKYLRFYSEEQNGGNLKNRVYWHLGEFQLNRNEMSPKSQYVTMGEIASNLEAVIEAQKDLNPEKVTIDDYNLLKTAYDAFMERFVDPAELRAALNVAEAKLALVRVGTQPGFWRSDEAAKTLQATIETAKAYDDAAVYTVAESANFIKMLAQQQEAIDNDLIPVQTGKWYRFRFGTEEEYAENNWNAMGNAANYRMIDGVATETMLNAAIFGSYMMVARRDYLTEKDNDGEYTQNFVVPVEADEVVMGDRLYHADLVTLENPDMALFRFIAVGDSAYVMQNKATGLFLQKKQENNDGIFLSVHPTLFEQKAVGYGQNALFIKTLNGVAQNPLHFALSQSLVLTYQGYGDSDGRRGCFFIEEAEDVAADYDGTAFKMNLKPGQINTFCFPVELTTEAGLYSVSKVDGTEVTLVPIAGVVPAGRPFIAINGQREDYNAEATDENDDTQAVPFTHGYDFVAEPENGGALVGTLDSQKVGSGVVVANGNNLIVAKRSDYTVAANSAYITTEGGFSLDATISLIIDEEGEDGIQTALAKVTQTGELYTLDGRILSRKANLSDMKRLGRGTYILNGTKVTVK